MDPTTDQLLTDIEAAAEALAAADKAQKDVRLERDRLIVAAGNAGVKHATIARHADLSAEGVSKIIRAAR